MAWDKQAWWFTPVSREHFHAKNTSNYIRWIYSQGAYDPAVEQIKSTTPAPTLG